MDTHLEYAAESAIGWELTVQDISEGLGEEISFAPPSEADADAQLDYEHCTVATAAQVLGKSERQVRRMLTSGELKGQKIDGRFGQVWSVERKSLSAASLSILLDTKIEDNIHNLESQLEETLQKVHSLEEQIIQLESDNRRLAEALLNELSKSADLEDLLVAQVSSELCKAEASSDISSSSDRSCGIASTGSSVNSSDGSISPTAKTVAPANSEKRTWWQRTFGLK